MRLLAVPLLLSLSLLPSMALAAASAQVPQPFPKPNDPNRPAGQAPPPPTRPGSPGAPAPGAPVPGAPGGQAALPDAAGAEAPPTEATLGAPVYPGAQFLTSFDAGQGQRYYLFGTSGSFAEVVNFYRTALRQRGDVVFEEPATHMFQVGRYREETMAFPPGVTVKDYTWGNLGGYLNPRRDAQPARFPTVIQMVPAPGGASR